MVATAQEPSYIDLVFGPEGLLAQATPGYQVRPGQVALATKIHDALTFEDHGFFEGPTGVGKSYAYLVPAIYWAHTKKRKTVIATANITLQDQLIKKDLPALQKILPWGFSFALQKGISNYLCVDAVADESVFEQMEGPQRSELLRWTRKTLRDDPVVISKKRLPVAGDRADLHFNVGHQLWSLVSSTSDECRGSKCLRNDACYARAARVRAMDADVVVVNYHLLYLSLSIPYPIMPDFDILICDEGHKAASIGRDVLGGNFGYGAFVFASRKIAKAGIVTDDWTRSAHHVFERAWALFKRPQYDTILTEAIASSEFFKDRWDWYIRCEAALEKEVWDRGSEAAIKAFMSLKDRMHRFCEMQSEQAVYYFEEDPANKSVKFAWKPLRVADFLREHVWDGPPRQDGVRKTAFVVSATLSTDNNFGYVSSLLGCDNYQSIIAESPFKLNEQCMLVVPKDLPEPNTQEFRAAVLKYLEETVEIARGRTLALFTSHAMRKQAYSYLSSVTKYKILNQGDASNQKLIEEFKKETSSVLLGSASFWAGVDVPGEALTALFIDKLPFASPTDPYIFALQRWMTSEGRRPAEVFMKYMVPDAIIELKQGVGRLIRTSKDFGFAVCCDRRLVDPKKTYGRRFVSSLGGVRVSRSMDDAKRFLAERELDAALYASKPRETDDRQKALF